MITIIAKSIKQITVLTNITIVLITCAMQVCKESVRAVKEIGKFQFTFL